MQGPLPVFDMFSTAATAARRAKPSDRRPELKSSWKSITWRVTLSNLPFILALAAIDLIPPFVRTLVVGGILFLAPGLAWTDRRIGDGFVVLFRAVVISLGAMVASWLLLSLPPGPMSRTAFLLALAAFTNAGLILGVRRGWYMAAERRSVLWRLLVAVAVLFYVQSYVGAAYRVPPLEDQDMETQGTAYGLIHALSPAMVTNRGTTFFFAHPLLLHFWIGTSALVSNDLDRLRYYYEASREMRGKTWEQLNVKFKEEFAQFERDPVLLATRTPNLFLGVLVIFPLGYLVYRISGSQAAAVLSCILYSTLPEVYVRSAYGGYMAVTNFLTLSTAYFYLQGAGLLGRTNDELAGSRGTRSSAFGAAFLSGWADQKALLIPAASGAHAALTLMLSGSRSFLKRVRSTPELGLALLVGSGFLLGWATFGLYGVTIDARQFISDHVTTHIVDRFRLTNVYFATVPQGGGKYPSIVALWRQFGEHTGWLLVVPCLLAMLRAVRQIRGPEGLLLVWVLVGAVGFSLVDWRQTKHLAHILPPMMALIGLFWASLHRKARLVLSVVLCSGAAWNIWRIGRLMADFGYLKPFRMW
jgi:hypothetical protein